ncbi:PREDICTED: uncharacterized protein LOC105987237 isoform X2 [Dipodomys ordii]|nr:PREDICTED: uncharacterized protein LOC105987237 isoform X2 [Dipodomys ordii]
MSCNATVIHKLQKFCRNVGRRDAKVRAKLTLQGEPQSESQVFLHNRDSDALKLMLEHIPEFSPELKTMLSQELKTKPFLRKTDHPKERATKLDMVTSFASLCCASDCIRKLKRIMCYIDAISQY